MDENKILINSSYQIECRTFNQWSGQIVIIGSIFYGKKEFREVEILHLTIDSDKQEELVQDVIFPLVPFLKPIPGFRDFLRPILCKLMDHEVKVIRGGARKYLNELSRFSPQRHLLRQARGCLDKIKPEAKNAEQVARKILEIVGETPATDIIFMVQE